MARLVPIEGNPFEQNQVNAQPGLVPVHGNPFAQPTKQSPQEQLADKVEKPERSPLEQAIMADLDRLEQNGKENNSGRYPAKTEADFEKYKGYPQGLLNMGYAADKAKGDATNIAQGLKHLVTNLPQAYEGLKTIASGVYNTVTTDETDPVIKAIGEEIKAAYGTPERFLESLENEPLSTAMAISFGTGVAAPLVKGAGKMSKVDALVNIGNKMGKVAGATDVIGQTAKAPFKMIPKGAARNQMESAMKASTTPDRANRNKVLDTMIKHNIVPDEAGLSKAWGKIEEFGAKVDNIIKEADASGQLIPKSKIFKSLRDVIGNAKFSDAPITNPKVVMKTAQEFGRAFKNHLTPSEAQKLKQGIYKGVNFDRKRGASKPMYNEITKKAIARDIKEGLEEVWPELKNVNASEGELLNIIEPLTKAVNRIGNRDVFGMGSFIKGGAGGVVGNMLGGTQGQAVGFLMGVMSANPKLQARFSILLDRARKLGEKSTKGRGAVAYETTQAGKTSQQVQARELPATN